MGKNKKKQIFDLVFIVLLLILIILGNVIKDENEIYIIAYIIFAFVVLITKIIFDIKVWICPNCREHLPIKPLYKNVECCSYCKAKID